MKRQKFLKEIPNTAKKIVNPGFTLAELLIVVVILGILGVLVIPRFESKVEKAKAAEAIAIVQAIRQGEVAYQLDHGSYLGFSFMAHTGWEKLGLDDPNANAQRLWDYGVFLVPPGTNNDFLVVARRINTRSSQLLYSGACVVTDRAGHGTSVRTQNLPADAVRSARCVNTNFPNGFHPGAAE